MSERGEDDRTDPRPHDGEIIQQLRSDPVLANTRLNMFHSVIILSALYESRHPWNH